MHPAVQRQLAAAENAKCHGWWRSLLAMGKDQEKQERWIGSDLFQRQPSQRHTMWCKSIVKPKNLKITHAAVCPPFCCFDYAVLCKSRPGRLYQAMNLTHKDIGLVVQKSSGARMQKKMFNLRMFFGAFVGIGLGFWLHCVLLVLAMKYYTAAATGAPTKSRPRPDATTTDDRSAHWLEWVSSLYILYHEHYMRSWPSFKIIEQ